MLVERPPEPRYGEIEVDGVKYKFRTKKLTPKYAQIDLLNYITEVYVKEIHRVPKDLPIGAPIVLKENKVCLFRSEVKPPVHWGKALSYNKRK